MAEGLTMKDVPADLGWSNPALDEMNKQAAELHQRAYMPVVETVMRAASPNASPDDRVAAGDFFKTANEARMGDVLGALVNLNPQQLYIALTGGSDIREIGYDATSKPYEVIYNQRNELRGYRDPQTGKMLTPEQLQNVGGITTKRDVTPERQKAFQAMGVTLGEVAKARTEDFINAKKVAAEAGANGDLIEQLGKRNNALSQRLAPASMDPKSLAFIRGITSMRTGDRQETRGVTDALKEGATGERKSSDFSSSVKNNIGVNLGLQYIEGKGWVDSKGNVQSRNDLERIGNSYEQSQSSDKAIETRQNDMLARAQTMFAGKAELLNDITELINNNAKIGIAQNAIEKFGGIGVARPNLPHQLGDSFMAARQKANSDEYYGAASKLFYDFVNRETANLPPGRVPDMGALKARFAQSEDLKRLQQAAIANSLTIDKENEEVAKVVNSRQMPSGLTNEPSRAPVSPPENATRPSSPRASAPPPAAPAQPARRALADIFR